MVYHIPMVKKFLFICLLACVVTASPAGTEDEVYEEIIVYYHPNAILVASYMGDEVLVKKILASGVDKNHKSASGGTALHMAILQKNMIIIKILLDYGFDPNIKDSKDGYTALHLAVGANNIEAARLLLQFRADKNIRSHAGQTPLEKARKEEKLELVRLLMR
jgi:ankyrin repeat protein